MERVINLLQDEWYFALGMEQPEASTFTKVQIPHDWAVGRPISPDAPLGMAQGWFHRNEIGWYRRVVTIGEKDPARRYFLDFGGVFECAKVWINGCEVGGQRYGYTPCRLEITDAVRTGENQILVQVDNTREPADRWYSGCGIYRPVKWMETDREYLDEKDIVVTTDIHDDQAGIRIQTGSALATTAVLSLPDGRLIAEGNGCGTIDLHVNHPLLWSAERPNLYDLTLGLPGGDAVTRRIGLRSVSIDVETGLRINGKKVKLHGVCLHQDMGCRGIAATKEMWRDRLTILKKMGCNALRLAHHMHSDEMLDLCDEMGFYVYSECFDKWHSGLYGRYFDQDWDHDLAAMIRRDRNRPSVISWGVGNEVDNQGQQSMVDTLAMLSKRAHELDGTRPVTYAMNPHFKRAGKKIDYSQVKDIQQLVDEVDDREIEDLEERIDCISAIAQHVDIISCNYQEQWFEAIHRRLSDKLILSTEAYPFFVGHLDSMQNYTQRVPALIPEALPYAIGSFVWAGYDYLGESMGWPSKGWTGSLFRMDGTPRISAYILKSHWTEEPMVHISILDNTLGDEFTKAHWANPPYEDVWDFPELHQGVVPYLIATNCDRVEIHCGDRVFYPPLPKENPDGYITGFVPWMPGKIEVLGFINGQSECSHALYTPEAPAKLTLSPMVQRILAPGEEMLLTASILDAQNHLCIREKRLISFRVEGDAEILATDNCNLMEQTPYSAHAVPAWHGKASVVFRRTGDGAFRIIAETDALESAVITMDQRGD